MVSLYFCDLSWDSQGVNWRKVSGSVSQMESQGATLRRSRGSNGLHESLDIENTGKFLKFIPYSFFRGYGLDL